MKPNESFKVEIPISRNVEDICRLSNYCPIMQTTTAHCFLYFLQLNPELYSVYKYPIWWPGTMWLRWVRLRDNYMVFIIGHVLVIIVIVMAVIVCGQHIMVLFGIFPQLKPASNMPSLKNRTEEKKVLCYVQYTLAFFSPRKERIKLFFLQRNQSYCYGT